jgi:glycosyltransferase involved in cell wall biosynthesis
MTDAARSTSAAGTGRPAWHIVTCEYPPALGGVADFSRVVAGALAGAGEQVHVWTPAPAEPSGDETVHPVAGGYRVTALGALDRALDACPAPRRLFLQWVPHGYGYKSLNLPFCLWLRRRARRGDWLEVMIHEPFLRFDRTRIRQNVGAAVHRLMLRVLLGAASRVWVSTPSFADRVRPFGPRGTSSPGWLPVPSPVAVVDDREAVAAMRTSLAGTAPLVGYFGTAYSLVSATLAAALADLVTRRPGVRIALAGTGTDVFAATVARTHPAVAAAICSSGPRSERDLSLLLQACDVFVQPYPDGASTRRTTLMALLSHGCAVVTNGGETTEEFWAGSGAVRFADGGAATVGRTAAALLADDAARPDLGGRARSLYRDRFDVPMILAALLGEAAGAAP